MKKITQKQMAFYKLYTARKEDRERFVATWECVGEILVKELGCWVMMSYKCPTRLTDLYQENPTLMERKMIRGKSGARYFAYRLRAGVTPDDIRDEAIKTFYDNLKKAERALAIRERVLARSVDNSACFVS